jgi:4-amino-4-deoxy-L-arabinose transferase-like glycosyltransferase
MSSRPYNSQALPPDTAPNLAPPKPGTLILLVFALAVIWFGNLEYRKLIDPDEGRYAEIPREMVVSGDWVTPRLNGFKYFEKPPLQYWATATAYTLFGEHHWTARLWPALTGAFGIALAFFVGRAFFGAAAGFCAALVLAGSVAYTVTAHVNALDSGLTFFMTLALSALMLALRDGAQPRENRAWMLVTWAAMALAVLSKGLIGIVLPAAILGIYIALQGDWGILRRLRIASGSLVFAAIAVPWFLLVQRANPEFFDFFFIHEHFERYLTAVHSRVKPWWFFLVILAVGILPWIVTLFDAPLRAWRAEAARAGFRPRRFLLIWAIFILVFFSLSHSKLPSYTLPMFPALALLLGERLTQLAPRALRWHLLPLVVIGLALLGLAPLAPNLADARMPEVLYRAYMPWLAAAGAVGALGGACALYLNHRGRIVAAITAAGFCGLVVTQFLVTGFDSFSPARSSYFVARKIEPYLRPDLPFYSVGLYDQTLPFYLKRTVTLVLFRGELDMGIKQAPQLWLPDLDAFRKTWRQQREAMAILHPAYYDELVASGLPMQVIAKDTRRVIVKTP